MEYRYLYRAKRKNWRELPKEMWWVEGYYAYFKQNDNHCIYYETDGFTLVCDIDISTLCACTGLKDKNGKLIWENDIVDFLGHKGIVKYECGSFGIAYRDYIDWEEIEANICPITGCDNALYACENDNFISLWEIYWNFNDEDDSVNTVEVIGSAIDNPELLEVNYGKAKSNILHRSRNKR